MQAFCYSYTIISVMLSYFINSSYGNLFTGCLFRIVWTKRIQKWKTGDYSYHKIRILLTFLCLCKNEAVWQEYQPVNYTNPGEKIY